MGKQDTHGLGYGRVDDDPNVSVLVDTMDTTSQWQATRRLRAWERQQLRLTEGRRLLDVGCGLGQAAFVLAEDLGDTGEIVGIDRSAEMLRVARTQAGTASCGVRFSVGDACALDEPDDSFDVVRSERMLQWIPEPLVAVVEMARVVRPGGRVGILDIAYVGDYARDLTRAGWTIEHRGFTPWIFPPTQELVARNPP